MGKSKLLNSINSGLLLSCSVVYLVVVRCRACTSSYVDNVFLLFIMQVHVVVSSFFVWVFVSFIIALGRF